MPNRTTIDQGLASQRILLRVEQDSALGVLASAPRPLEHQVKDAVDELGTRIGRGLAILISAATVAGFVWFFLKGL